MWRARISDAGLSLETATRRTGLLVVAVEAAEMREVTAERFVSKVEAREGEGISGDDSGAGDVLIMVFVLKQCLC